MASDCLTLSGIIASTTIDLPRPRIQLMADGFLSVHILPLIATRIASGNSSSKTSIAFRHPFET